MDHETKSHYEIDRRWARVKSQLSSSPKASLPVTVHSKQLNGRFIDGCDKGRKDMSTSVQAIEEARDIPLSKLSERRELPNLSEREMRKCVFLRDGRDHSRQV